MAMTTGIMEEVRRARLRLFVHICRMDEGRIPRIIMEEGHQVPQSRRGRPLLTWHLCVEADLQKRGLGFHTAGGLARKSMNKYRERIVYGNRPTWI